MRLPCLGDRQPEVGNPPYVWWADRSYKKSSKLCRYNMIRTVRRISMHHFHAVGARCNMPLRSKLRDRRQIN